MEIAQYILKVYICTSQDKIHKKVITSNIVYKNGDMRSLIIIIINYLLNFNVDK